MSALPFPPLLERLGLTLLHALWLLMALALVAWVGLALLRRASAQARYLWASACLVAMPVACGVAFALLGNPDPGPLPLAVLQAVPVTATLTPPPPSFWEGLRGPLAPWLALAWMVGALVQVLRLGGAVWRVQRIFLGEAEPAPPAWEQACRQLARYLGMTVPVRLLVSTKVSTPLTLGWLRPVVLLPASSLLHLSPEALEAVLAHELAHVRRLDYLANLLQTLIDALLFFHPAARWLSGQIRELREHCCDDEAAALCGDPVVLAQGLTALERLRRNPESAPEPALAAARGSLMSRITRMLVPQPAPLPAWRGLALVLAAASLLGAAGLALPQKQAPANPEAPTPATYTVPLVMKLEPAFYPADARDRAVQGTVKLLARSRAKGFTVQALEGPPHLRAASEAYVRHSFERLGPVLKDIDWQITMACDIPVETPLRDKAISKQQFEQAKAAIEHLKGQPLAEDLKPVVVQIMEAERAKRDADREKAAVADPKNLLENEAGLKLISRGNPPRYPPAARLARVQGMVECRLHVGPDGIVQRAEALSGPEELREAARTRALTFLFEKSPKGGAVIIRQHFKISSPQDQAASRLVAQEATVRAHASAVLISASDPALKVDSVGSFPGYPPIARMARIQGDVDVELTVTPEGTVSAAKALSGPPPLRLSAEKAASGWTFAPTAKGGTATVRIPFRLE